MAEHLRVRRLGPWWLVAERHLYRLWEIQHLSRLFQDLQIDCVFDVGANAGQYAQMLREKVGYTGRIISFEPIPELAEALRSTSRSDNLWSIEEVALGPNTGTVEFHVARDSQFSTLGSPAKLAAELFGGASRVDHSVEVPARTLKEALAEARETHDFRRPFLKMDTQGFDTQVALSAGESIKEFLALQSELAIRPLYEESIDYKDALRLYEDMGFMLSAFVPNNAGTFPALTETDCVMVRSDLAQMGKQPR